MTLSEKSAYLKGLMEGMKLDTETNEGKLISEIISMLQDVAENVSDLEEVVDCISDELDCIEEDLDNIDDYLMDDDDDEYDDDYDEDDDYEDADEDDDQDEYDFGSETLYEVKCPTCGEVITIDEEMLDEGATTCPNCGGTRLNKIARSSVIDGKTLPEALAMPLGELIAWVKTVPGKMPDEMQPMAESIVKEFLSVSERLIDLGLDYLTPDRAANTLSTGELQRIQLARAVRNKTTGVLYVLDEPSIGLHPANVDGLLAVIRDLVKRGNSVAVVDHDTRVISAADYVIEMGAGAGKSGGNVLGLQSRLLR